MVNQIANDIDENGLFDLNDINELFEDVFKSEELKELIETTVDAYNM